jgi:hypothetical protein
MIILTAIPVIVTWNKQQSANDWYCWIAIRYSIFHY